MNKTNILFVCEHNSARSQMAESIINNFYGDRFEAESAGYEDRPINPYAVKAMAEIGIDISQNRSKTVFDLFKAGRLYKYVITVCDAAKAEKCPIFPGIVKTLNWSFSDPSVFEGSESEKLSKTIEIRNEIKDQIDKWVKTA